MAFNNLERCFKFTVGEEGRYSDDPSDPGNWSGGEVGSGVLIGSCWGISAPTLISWSDVYALPVTAEVMRNLPLETALAIYTDKYWDKMRCEDIPPGLDLAVFDFGVNAGPHESGLLLQEALGFSYSSCDGVIGPVTLNAAVQSPTATTIKKLVALHVKFYQGLPNFAKDGPGWLNRQGKLLETSLAMVA